MSLPMVVAIGRSIRQRAALPDSVTVVVIPSSFDELFEGRDFHLGNQEYVTYMDEVAQLRNLVHRLLHGYSRAA